MIKKILSEKSKFTTKDRYEQQKGSKCLCDVEVSLIEANLKLTPTQRLIQHQSALDLLWEIDKAKEVLHAKP